MKRWSGGLGRLRRPVIPTRLEWTRMVVGTSTGVAVRSTWRWSAPSLLLAAVMLVPAASFAETVTGEAGSRTPGSESPTNVSSLGPEAPGQASTESGGVPPIPGAVAVTLDEVLSRALVNAPAVVQAAGRIRTSKAGERSAFGAWLPSASLSAGGSLNSAHRFNPQTDTLVSGSSTSMNAGLSASWEVFTGGRRLAEMRQARAETESASADLEAQRAQAAFLAERAFYEEERAEELVRVALARVERAREGLEAATRRSTLGTATRSDVLRARLELSTAQESLRNAESQRHGASWALGRLIGIDGPADAKLTALVEPTPLEEEQELVSELVRQAPSVRAAEMATRVAEASISTARSRYFPSLRLTAGHDWFNQESEWGQGRTSWSVRLGLSFPIFDGFLREENVERALVQDEVSRAVLADTRRAVRAEAERMLARLRFERDRITFAEQAVEVAAEDLRVQQERYRLGVGVMLDLLASQASLVEAESSLVAARFDYQVTRSEIEALAGRRL